MNADTILDQLVTMTRQLAWAHEVMRRAVEMDSAKARADHLEMAAKQCALLARTAADTERAIARKEAAIRRILLKQAV